MASQQKKPKLADYKPVMYKSGLKSSLSTGDIFKFDSAFFKEFSKYKEILSVIDSFSSNEDYTSGYWTLLNKPCDMVHNPEADRYFDDNLILCPLRNFLSCFDSDGPLYDCVQKQTAEIQPHKMLLNTYEDFTNDFMNSNFKVIGTKEEKALIVELRKNAKNSMIEYFGKIFDEVDISINEIENKLSKLNETEPPETLKQIQFVAFQKNLTLNQKWIKYRERLMATKAIKGPIQLKKSGLSKVSNITLNQTDTQGLFFFEPHKKLITSNDISYIIELQELITWKVKKEKVSSGLLHKALLEKRVLCLTDNFSDRLLNIMGNYFSKIGTSDVSASPIVKLYEDNFVDRFKLVEEEKKDKK